MSFASFLNCGRADCSVLFLNDFIIVIDGGGKYFNNKKILFDFLNERQINHIDLLILTHLHQDHFGGFYHLINKIRVKTAVIPYGDIVFNEFVRDYYINNEFFSEYHEFYEYLLKSNTEIIRPETCVGGGFFLMNFT